MATRDVLRRRVRVLGYVLNVVGPALVLGRDPLGLGRGWLVAGVVLFLLGVAALVVEAFVLDRSPRTPVAVPDPRRLSAEDVRGVRRAALVVCAAGLVMTAFVVVIVLAQDSPAFWFSVPLFLAVPLVLGRQIDWFDRFQAERGRASWFGLLRYLGWLADRTRWPRSRVLVAFAVAWFVPPVFLLTVFVGSAWNGLVGYL